MDDAKAEAERTRQQYRDLRVVFKQARQANFELEGSLKSKEEEAAAAATLLAQQVEVEGEAARVEALARLGQDAEDGAGGGNSRPPASQHVSQINGDGRDNDNDTNNSRGGERKRPMSASRIQSARRLATLQAENAHLVSSLAEAHVVRDEAVQSRQDLQSKMANAVQEISQEAQWGLEQQSHRAAKVNSKLAAYLVNTATKITLNLVLSLEGREALKRHHGCVAALTELRYGYPQACAG